MHASGKQALIKPEQSARKRRPSPGESGTVLWGGDQMKSCRYLSIFVLLASTFGGPNQLFAQDATYVNTVGASLAENHSDDPQRAAYEYWVHRYESGPLRGALGDNHRIKFTITAVEGDDHKPDDKTSSPFDTDSFIIRYGCAVSIDGTVSFFQFSNFDVKGSGPENLPKENLEKLNQLIAHLPADGSRLPAPGRRLVFRMATRDDFLVRVYDRANAPDEILEILRLTQSRIKSWAPSIEPQSKWTAGDSDYYGGFSLSADGTQIVSSSANGPLKIWDADSFSLVKEFPLPFIPLPDGYSTNPSPVFGLTFSPDGSMAIVDGMGQVDVLNARSWQGIRQLEEPFVGRQRHGLTCPIFTPDGRYLLLQSDEPALRIFDTRKWNRVDSILGMAPEAVAYFPAQNGDRAIYASKSGSIGLWDTRAYHEVAELDRNARVLRVSFSPDESLVAVITLHQNSATHTSNNYRLRIWRVSTGKLGHELRPFEQPASEIAGILWWPNGKYLLAATRSDSIFTVGSVGIWNVESGRFRGEFSGCITAVYGFALLPDGKRLVEGCGDGTVLVWDAANAIAKISQFESILREDR
jgi:WD40 repeat protein